MKKILSLLIIIVLATSCGIIQPGISYVTDYTEQMTILKNKFPEIYELYRQGDIRLDQMYTYKDANGNEKVRISYSYR